MGDLHRADVLHAVLLALLLLLQQLPFARDVAAVALGQNVLALGLDRLAGNHTGADGSLDWHVEELAGNDASQSLDEGAPGLVGLVAVDDDAEGVDRLTVEQNVDLRQLRIAVADHLVVERGVALRAALQLVVEVEHDLGERQRVDKGDPSLGEVVHLLELATAVLAELHDRADELLRNDHRGANEWLLNVLDDVRVRHVRWIANLDAIARRRQHVVEHVRRRRN